MRTHDRSEETPEAKARWFRSLTMAERMDLLCWFTDLALTRCPELAEREDAEPSRRRVQVVERP